MTTPASVAPGAYTALDLHHLDLTPEQTARTVGRDLRIDLTRQLRADGGPRPDFARQLAQVRQQAHASLDARLDDLAREVASGFWGPPLGRRLRLAEWGQR